MSERPRPIERDPWDEVVEDSFPASDPPPGPAILGGPPWRDRDPEEPELTARLASEQAPA